MKRTTIFLVATCLLAVSCGPRKPSIALNVYPEKLGNDTLYLLKATVTNESTDSIFVVDNIVGAYLKIVDSQGKNRYERFRIDGYYDMKELGSVRSISDTNMEKYDESFLGYAVEKDLERTKRLNFLLKDDSVKNKVLRERLEEKYSCVTLLAPNQSVDLYELINSLYRDGNGYKIRYKYPSWPRLFWIIPRVIRTYEMRDGRDGIFFALLYAHCVNELGGYKRFRGGFKSEPLYINYDKDQQEE